MREFIEEILHFQCGHAYSLPLNIEALCRTLELELRPLSAIVRESGMSAAEVCAFWGNPDGALQRHGGRYVICYNDARITGKRSISAVRKKRARRPACCSVRRAGISRTSRN